MQLAVSLYVTIQLRPLEKVPANIKNYDYKIITYNKKLMDILINQVRYEKKFIITQDKTLYDHFFENKTEFNYYLSELPSMVNATQSKDLLIEIERAYNQYLLLFNEEINYLKVAKDYPEKEYQQKKEDILNIIIEKLRELTSLTEQSSYERIEQLVKQWLIHAR